MIQNMLGFGMNSSKGFNSNFLNYNQLIQTFSEIKNQCFEIPMSSETSTHSSSVLIKNYNSAMSAAATALFFQHQAATTAAINSKKRFDLTLYTTNLTNINENSNFIFKF